MSFSSPRWQVNSLPLARIISQDSVFSPLPEYSCWWILAFAVYNRALKSVRDVSPKLSSLNTYKFPNLEKPTRKTRGSGKPTSDLSVDTQAKLYAPEHLRALTAVLLSPVPTVGSLDNQLCALLGLGAIGTVRLGVLSARETSTGGPWKQRDAGRRPCEAEMHSAC